MSLSGPILIVEDDPDDQLLLKEIFTELNLANPLHFFSHGQEALTYLKVTTEQPFLILCDVNMPVMNGVELRQAVFENETLRRKSVPFIFLTTSADKKSVNLAYDLSVQGFYVKGNTYEKLFEQIRLIVTYWEHCLHPNRHFPQG